MLSSNWRMLVFIFVFTFFVQNSAVLQAQTSIIIGLSEKEEAKLIEIEKALDKTCQLQLSELPLSELPKKLAASMGLTVKIDSKAFEEEKIDIKVSSLTYQFKNNFLSFGIKLNARKI